MTDEQSSSAPPVVVAETIAIFGATGRTGKETLKLALSRGYKVRALVRNVKKLADIITTDPNNDDSLVTIEGSFEDMTKLEQVFSTPVEYVICMASAPPPSDDNTTYPPDFMLNFVQKLQSVLDKQIQKPKVLLYQAGSMSTDGNGYLHPMAQVSKHTLGRKLNIFPKIHDNDTAIQYLAKHTARMAEKESDDGMHLIVTRAGVLKDKPSERELVVSSWPPMPIMYYATYADLAKFSLDALKNKDLYDTCPFVR